MPIHRESSAARPTPDMGHAGAPQSPEGRTYQHSPNRDLLVPGLQSKPPLVSGGPAWAVRTCAEQGIATKVTDLGAITTVAALFGSSSPQRRARESAQPRSGGRR